MSNLRQARRHLRAPWLDPDSASRLAAAAAAEATSPLGQVAALLALHEARRMMGDEPGARDAALYALRVARHYDLPELVAGAQNALLRLHAGALAVQPLLADVRESWPLYPEEEVPWRAAAPAPVAPAAALAGTAAG